MVMEHTPGKVIKRGFGLKEEVAPSIQQDFHHPLVHWMRRNGNRLDIEVAEFRLAQEFGFCYGVDFAIDYAYETRLAFPERRILITGEIIHNPLVNSKLRQMGVEMLEVTEPVGESLDHLTPEDVVLIPAFGVSFPLLEDLKKKGCVLVDTTCASVVNVWRNVERYAKNGLTSVIHGKYQHEETIATASYAQRFGGNYVIVRDLEETDVLCDIITGRQPASRFAEVFGKCCSPGFDPDLHLNQIGVANQTTMLSRETLEVQKRLADAVQKKTGVDSVDQATFKKTICSATQDRQDAIEGLISEKPDVLIVIGGFNSSNTSHLAAIGRKHDIPTWHISCATDLQSADSILHKPDVTSEPVGATDWLPRKDRVTIGVTAGASTPNQQIGQAIERMAGYLGRPLDLSQYELPLDELLAEQGADG